MGFYVSFDLNTPFTNEAELAFWNKLIDFVEGLHLEIGGSMSSFYVTRDGRSTTTNADRKALETWLQQQPEVSR